MVLKDRCKKGLTWSLTMLGLSHIFLNHAFAQTGRYGDWHMGRWMMGDWGMGPFGMIVMLLFWVLIIVGIIFLVRWLVKNAGSRSHSGASTGSQAMNILKERYARGEITRDEFESMKKEILQ